MAEWLKAVDSKSTVRVRVPGVRIPLSPPLWCAGETGEVTEWLKVHAWKACVGKLTGGSNPPLSATHPGEGRVLKTGTREPRQVREEATVVGAFRALGAPGSHPGGWHSFQRLNEIAEGVACRVGATLWRAGG